MQTNFHPDEPESHGNGKRKRKKPYAIEWRSDMVRMWRNWTVYKRYETEEDRDKAYKKLTSSNLFQYRIAE